MQDILRLELQAEKLQSWQLMDKRDGRDGSQFPSEDEADALHLYNQIKFIEIFLEMAERDYKTGQTSAGDRARRTARDAYEELKVFTRNGENQKPDLLSQLTVLEERFRRLAGFGNVE